MEIRQKAPVNKIGGKASGNGVEVIEVEGVAEVQWGRLGGNTRGRGGRGRSYSVNYDPLACYRCGVRGHLGPRLSPKNLYKPREVAMLAPSRGTFTQSGQKGPRGRGRGRQVRFGGP